jgi:hypothetical protein
MSLLLGRDLVALCQYYHPIEGDLAEVLELEPRLFL